MKTLGEKIDFSNLLWMCRSVLFYFIESTLGRIVSQMIGMFTNVAFQIVIL